MPKNYGLIKSNTKRGLPLGFKHSVATKEKIRQAKLGRARPDMSGTLNYFFGTKPTSRYSQKGFKKPYLTSQRGHNHHFWKGGITPTHQAIRVSQPYKDWRRHVFNRDNYICQACGKRGGRLHADHELPFSLYPDLRLEILNGRTMCIPCHKLTPTYGNSKTMYV